MRPSSKSNASRFLAALVSLLFAGCIPSARWYEPVSPLKAKTAGAELQAKAISRALMFTVTSADVHARDLDVAFGRPRLTSPEQPECSSGEGANGWATGLTDRLTRLDPGTHGVLTASFTNANIDREGLLLVRPTVLDVPVARFAGTSPATSSCLRLPLLVAGGDTVEWRQRPGWWFGAEVRVEVPKHRLENVGATVVAPISIRRLCRARATRARVWRRGRRRSA